MARNAFNLNIHGRSWPPPGMKLRRGAIYCAPGRDKSRPYGWTFTVKALAVLVLLAWLMPAASLAAPAEQPPDAILLTIFLKHDQSKTLGEIDAHLQKTSFWKKFPPPGVEVVSWYVMMGLGQVVTLRVPPDKLRAVNLAIEQNAWGAFRTEFYPTYDFRPVWEGTYKNK